MSGKVALDFGERPYRPSRRASWRTMEAFITAFARRQPERKQVVQVVASQRGRKAARYFSISLTLASAKLRSVVPGLWWRRWKSMT